MIDAPKDPAASLIYEPTDILNRLPLADLFPVARPLETELGSGDGSFAVNYALSRPDINFLAVERLLGRLRKIARKGRRAGLSNLRCLRIEASYCLEFLIPPGSLQALHVYFPDPWPKRKHWRRRLVNAHFVEVCRRALVPGGVVYLRTDDASYFTQMREVFAAATYFVEIETPVALAALTTDFERGFNERGIRTRHAAYRLREAANGNLAAK